MFPFFYVHVLGIQSQRRVKEFAQGDLAHSNLSEKVKTATEEMIFLPPLVTAGLTIKARISCSAAALFTLSKVSTSGSTLPPLRPSAPLPHQATDT